MKYLIEQEGTGLEVPSDIKIKKKLGRPGPAEEVKRVMVNLPLSLFRLVAERAKTEGKSLSAVLVEIVRQAEE